MADKERELSFEYTNWRGDHSIRRVLPKEIWFGTTEWHPQAQWFLKGTDLEKGEIRDFAIQDMKFRTIT